MIVFSIRSDNTPLEYNLRLDFNNVYDLDDWLYTNGNNYYKIVEQYNSIDGGSNTTNAWEYYDMSDNELNELNQKLTAYFNKHNKLI